MINTVVRLGGDRSTTQIVNSGAQVLFAIDEGIARNSAVTGLTHCQCACDSALDDHSTARAVCFLLTACLPALAGPQASERLTVIELQYDVLHEL